MSPDTLERICLQYTQVDLIQFCIRQSFLKAESICETCNDLMSFVVYKQNIDSFAWRCMQKQCTAYKTYKSTRKGSFFENLRLPLSDILRIIIRYSTRQPLYSIKLSFDYNETAIKNILKKLKSFIPETDFSSNKLGGPNFIVQVDETMLNYKVKSHRGRPSHNKTDSLCIIECFDNITRAYAKIIPEKKQETIIPILCSQVANKSIIWTDEHKSYSNLSQYSFSHGTVCHKYEFVSSEAGINTQSIESFHNELKLEIKRRKGILTEKREDFLREFCFYFNHRSNFFEVILNFIKI